jgi:hypothetical protein
MLFLMLKQQTIMKKILIILTLLTSTSIYAQIPNAGFEAWDSIRTFNLTHWQLLGDAKQVTDSKSGAYAIALTNKKDNGAFGVFANSVIQEGLNGGEAYNERPITFLLYAKYDIDSLDRGSVTAIFKSQGNIAGIAEISFRGTSNGQFELKSIPVQWYSFDQPDTLLIIGASIDLDKGYPEEDGFLMVDSMHFKSVVTLNKAPINASFEDRQEEIRYEPKNWVTIDRFLFEEFGQRWPMMLANRTADSYAGTYAVLLENKVFGEDTVPGVMFVGTSTDNIEGPSFSVAGKSTYVNGYYKYIPEGGDKALIQLTLFKNGAEVGKIIIDDILPSATWKPFSKAIGYFNSTIPDSAALIISSADLDNPRGANSKLWIDALELSNTFLGVIDVSATIGPIYPNPAENFFYIPSVKNHPIEWVIIKDVQGKICVTIDAIQNAIIDISSLNSGMYWVELKTSENTTTTKLIKK